MANKNSVYLDVDHSILENNLLIKDTDDDELDTLFPIPNSAKDLPWKVVQPTPGLCLKARSDDGNKIFVNICQTDQIPAPKDLTDEELLALWSSEELCDFRVPMSIAEGRKVSDKSGNQCTAYDIAINPTFFNKIEDNKLFLKFLLEVTAQALEQKYNLDLNSEDFIILKNRKAMGTLVNHRIQIRPSASVGPLIQELSSQHFEPKSKFTTLKKVETEKLSANVSKGSGDSLELQNSAEILLPENNLDRHPYKTEREPQYRILHETLQENPNRLVAEVYLEDVVKCQEITFDVGEDRIIVECRKKGYLLDAFVPYSIDQDKCEAFFDTSTKVLTLQLPVMSE